MLRGFGHGCFSSSKCDGDGIVRLSPNVYYRPLRETAVFSQLYFGRPSSDSETVRVPRFYAAALRPCSAFPSRPIKVPHIALPSSSWYRLGDVHLLASASSSKPRMSRLAWRQQSRADCTVASRVSVEPSIITASWTISQIAIPQSAINAQRSA